MLQSILDFVMAWYNLPFTILLAICVVLAMLQWIGLGGEHDSDSDADMHADFHADADADADFHMDVHADADADADADLHLDAHADADPDADLHADTDFHTDADASADAHADVEHDLGHAEHEVGHAGESGFSVLAYLGLGRAPLMVILLMLFGSVGLLGWFFNSILFRSLGGYPGLAFGAVFLLALVIGSYISSRIARFIGRTLPPVSTTATAARSLVGRRGTVISPYIDGRYGMVHLRDVGGTLISVFAVTEDGQPIRRGEEVILVQYNIEKRTYEVVRADFS